MKNIHILPTDKPSRLYTNMQGVLSKDELKMRLKNYNIYITNDEEIKEGDWVLFMFDEVTEIVKVTTIVNNAFDSKEGFGYGLEYSKKIILTTDQDLIKDGVQPIDDEFLEWFVKNPSCEEVKVNKSYGGTYYITYPYKIIIPKKELGGIPKGTINMVIGKPKQETPEEFIKEVLNEEFFTNISEYRKAERLIELGVKWNQENILELLRSNGYEDEPIFDLINNYLKS